MNNQAGRLTGAAIVGGGLKGHRTPTIIGGEMEGRAIALGDVGSTGNISDGGNTERDIYPGDFEWNR